MSAVTATAAAPDPDVEQESLEPPNIAHPGAYPGARRPDRSRWVSSAGLRIATYEWGDPDARVILMAHGGFDFAGTFDGFAPLLADAGYRVVSWDCLLYTSPSPRDGLLSRMPSSA